MPYTESKIQAIAEGVDSSTKAVVDIAATGTALLRVSHPCDLFAVGALILITPTSTAAALTVTRRKIPGSDGSGATAATAVATITIPTTAVVGNIVWKKCHISTVVLPVKLEAGDELVFVMAGTTLTWRPWVEAYPRSEIPANNSDFILSA